MACRHIALVLALAFALGAAPLAAEPQDWPARRLWVIDGDTLDILSDPKERVRLVGVDAPESWQPHCEAERAAGLRAKEAAIALVRAGRTATIDRSGHKDRYGRTLAGVAIDGRDLGAHLSALGLALPWRPGGAAKASRIAHWCSAPAP